MYFYYTITLNENGRTIINDGTTAGIVIKDNNDNKQFYADSNGNLNLGGIINAIGGIIDGWQIGSVGGIKYRAADSTYVDRVQIYNGSSEINLLNQNGGNFIGSGFIFNIDGRSNTSILGDGVHTKALYQTSDERKKVLLRELAHQMKSLICSLTRCYLSPLILMTEKTTIYI